MKTTTGSPRKAQIPPNRQHDRRPASQTTLRKAMCALLAAALVAALAPGGIVAPGAPPAPSAAYAAGSPVAVDGRIITRDKTGDTSDWLEIAQCDGYALIIRVEPLNGSLDVYNTSLVNSYSASICRQQINNWYNSRLSGAARLRDYAVSSNAMTNLGSYGTVYVDGISVPTGAPARTGNDVAFALSYCEAAFYCSTQYVNQWSPATVMSSSNTAYNNYHKLSPRFTTGDRTPAAYWLRTPGANYYDAGCVSFMGGAPSPATYERACGRVASHTVIGTFGYYRPAMWVGTGLFMEKATVRVIHRDAANPSAPLRDDSYAVDPGYYGPYGSQAFSGYTYIGLAAGSDQPSGTIAAGQTKTVIHEYRRDPTTYTVVLHSNFPGGPGPFSMQVAAGATFLVPAPQWSVPGYTFTSWNTRADGLGTTYMPGDYITVNSDMSLYAQWRQEPCNVTYYPNGGSGTARVYPVALNSYHYVFDQGFTWSGRQFAGWNTRADGSGSRYQNGEAMLVTGNVELYAQWGPAQPTTFDIKYEPNGASGPARTYTMNANYYHYVFDQGYTWADHAFTGWNTRADGGGTAYQNGSPLLMTADVTLYAQWRELPAPTYTVTYYANGDSGMSRSYSANANSTHYVFDQGFVWAGHVQDGWNTRPDGTGTQYQNGSALAVTGNVALYAQWRLVPPPTYTVTYYPNGGSGTARSYTVNANSTHYVFDQGYTMAGSAQNGWNTISNGSGAAYQNGSGIVVTGDVNLYAQWRATPPPTYTVTYYPNGGVGASNTYPVNANATHYVFDQGYYYSNQTQSGWNTRPDGAGTAYANGAAITMTDNITLYAQWSRSDSSITYMPNGGFGQSFVDYGANRNFEIKPCPFVGDNAVFMYWNTAPDGYGATIPVGTELRNFYGNLTLYAIWRTGV